MIYLKEMMDLFDHILPQPKGSPKPGNLLIADPFLKDPNFSRSVILLCEHQENGSFGFMVNKLSSHHLEELNPGAGLYLPVYFGGPVQLDTLHFIHKHPDLFEGCMKVSEGVYWGGDFDTAVSALISGDIKSSSIKFFMGYAGWESGQLNQEFRERSWILSKPKKRIIFGHSDSAWEESLRGMGKKFALLANFPLDPSLN